MEWKEPRSNRECRTVVRRHRSEVVGNPRIAHPRPDSHSGEDWVPDVSRSANEEGKLPRRVASIRACPSNRRNSPIRCARVVPSMSCMA